MNNPTYQRNKMKITENDRLVGIEKMLEIVFPDPESRPCKRTAQDWQSRGWLPYIKIKRKVFFDPAECRRAIDRQFKVKVSN